MKDFIKYLSLVEIVLFLLGSSLVSLGEESNALVKQKPAQSKNEGKNKSGANLSEQEVDTILHKKRPKAEIMEVFIDYEHERLIYWGRLFEDSSATSAKKSAQDDTKRKFEFVLDGHNGKFLYWQEFVFQFPPLTKSEGNRTILSKDKIKELVQAKVPEAEIDLIEWNMNNQLVYYDVTFTQKDKNVYRYAMDAYTGEVVNTVTDNKANKTKVSTLSEGEKKELEKQRLRSACIPEKKINTFLQSKVPGADVVNLRLDLDTYPPVYKGSMIHHNKVYKFQFNALNGALLQWDHKIYHEPIFVYRGERTVSRPVPPSVPIMNIPQVPITPGTLYPPSAPRWVTPPNVPRVPAPPRIPNKPLPPKIPVPQL